MATIVKDINGTLVDISEFVLCKKIRNKFVEMNSDTRSPLSDSMKKFNEFVPQFSPFTNSLKQIYGKQFFSVKQVKMPAYGAPLSLKDILVLKDPLTLLKEWFGFDLRIEEREAAAQKMSLNELYRARFEAQMDDDDVLASIYNKEINKRNPGINITGYGTLQDEPYQDEHEDRRKDYLENYAADELPRGDY